MKPETLPMPDINHQALEETAVDASVPTRPDHDPDWTAAAPYDQFDVPGHGGDGYIPGEA